MPKLAFFQVATLTKVATLNFSKLCEYTLLTFLYNLLLVLDRYLFPSWRRCNYKFAMTHGRTDGRTHAPIFL